MITKQVKKAKAIINSGRLTTPIEYYWTNKYDVVTTGGEDHLITKNRRNPRAPTVRILPREQYYDTLLELHNLCGHGQRDKILDELQSKYYMPRKAAHIFVSLCPICRITKNVEPKQTILVKPALSRNFNIRGQVDLLDFQSCPDGEYKWLLIYQDNAITFVNVRPLKTNETAEVAYELMKIFLTFGAPCVLQSDNGREFVADVIKELSAKWPDFKIVDASCPQTKNEAKSPKNVENKLHAWMTENKSTNWSVGCYFVQYNKNNSIYSKINRTPYRALFGYSPKADINTSDIPASLLATVVTERQLKNIVEEQKNPTTQTSTN